MCIDYLAAKYQNNELKIQNLLILIICDIGTSII